MSSNDLEESTVSLFNSNVIIDSNSNVIINSDSNSNVIIDSNSNVIINSDSNSNVIINSDSNSNICTHHHHINMNTNLLDITPITIAYTSLEVSGVSLFHGNVNINSNVNITSNVNIYLDNNSNIVLSTVNGSTFGTTPDQKISFYGAVPTPQFNSNGEVFGSILHASVDPLDNVLYNQSTYTGNVGGINAKAYTINDIVKSLKLVGILAH